MNGNLKLKSINEILDKSFFIPSYQRGYRWDNRQVEDLLEDILEFSKRKERNLLEQKEFYCLQPIVVKYDENKKHYRVIDGQQRLTTIFIILKYLEKVRKIIYGSNQIYKIIYETRNQANENSWEFLQQINTINKIDKRNIDFYYMSKAYFTIKNFFENKEINKANFLGVILSNDIEIKNGKNIDYANNIRVIWYEIKDENEINVFTRLNIGKIPLTNSELIKGMFLLDKSKVKTNEKIILASQWDEIEYKLQNSSFFAFINEQSKEYKKPTKIEYIFDLIASNTKLKVENLKKGNEKFSYYIFEKLLDSPNNFKDEFNIETKEIEYDKRVEILWDEVKTYFRIFEEFYEDTQYYHYVGYLVNNGKNINEIIQIYKNKQKDDFLKYLKDEISNLIKTEKKVDSLEYDKDRKIIEKVLFLFNVVLTMNSNYSKYPFDLHKEEEWSLEHIHAQNSKYIKKDEDKRVLLEDQKKYIENEELKTKIDELLNQKKIEDEEFNKIQEEIFKAFSGNFNMDLISNMALLSKRDNSVLNNSIFPSKRDKIIELDKKGSFIPIGTKNVFLKYYSDNVKEAVIWDKKDREAYLKALKNTLNDFIKEVRNG